MHAFWEKMIRTACPHLIFSHPDFTVGTGISPVRHFVFTSCSRALPPVWNFTNPQRSHIFDLFLEESAPRQLSRCRNKSVKTYARMLDTTPEPTVLPPSRIAKRRPSSQAMGVMSSTVMSTLSPGRHISTPAGSSITPVTSVVLK